MSAPKKEQIKRRTFLKDLGVAGLVVADTWSEAAGLGSPDGPDRSGRPRSKPRDEPKAGSAALPSGRDKIPLDGPWQFQTDPESIGLRDRWYLPDRQLDTQLEVPGCWQAQGVGPAYEWLRHDYLGWGWYKREVSVPDSWRGRQVWLKLSGVARSARIFCNGVEVGYHNGFSSPFRVDVSAHLTPGGNNTIAILVDNAGGSKERGSNYPADRTRPVGTFNYLGNWGGIYGHVELEATGEAWVDSIHVRTMVAPAAATFKLEVAGGKDFSASGLRLQIQIRACGKSGGREYAAQASVDLAASQRAGVSIDVPMPDAELWSPEQPTLYVADIRLVHGARVLDSIEQKFGVREIAAKGGKILLNGRPYYLVGYGDDSVEVITGVPPASLEEHRRRIRIAKSYGFNSVRFHSRIPTEELFQAADELGLLIQAELPVVYPSMLLPHLEFLWSELENVNAVFRNHPSWISLALGNELIPRAGKESEFAKAFEEFYAKTKRLNPDILALSCDGWTRPPSDYFSMQVGYVAGQTTLAHEFGGYYCSLPDVPLLPRFTGVAEPLWLRTTAAWFKENGLESAYPKLLESSQRMLNGEMRKFRIEQLRRLPEIQGYALWLITDFPSGIEGFDWEQGVLNYFWEPKTVSPEEFSKFNALNVIVSDTDISERAWWEGSAARAGICSSYYGNTVIPDAELSYQLVFEGKRVVEGKKSGVRLTPGEVTSLGGIEVSVPIVGRPAVYTLQVTLARGTETIAENSWTYWAYPKQLLERTKTPVVSRIPEKRLAEHYPFLESHRAARPGDLVLTGRLEQPDYAAVLGGASAIVFLEQNRGDAQRPFEFFPSFTGDPHAYGSMVEAHPLFRNFPNRGYFEAQFYNLTEGSFGLDPDANAMSEFGSPIQTVTPLVWCAWSSGTAAGGLKKLGFLYEFRVGRGKVLMSTLNFRKYLDDAYPSVVYLFDQLLRYALSDEFSPAAMINETQFSYFLRSLRR